MDPNETLRLLRERAANVIRQADEGLDNPEACFDLAEAFQNLDEWISKGGFLPDAWKNT
jgi:hypothetical protein